MASADQQPDDADKRREHPRSLIAIRLRIEVYERKGRSGQVNGVTINISRGGILALLEDEIGTGSDSHCLVCFIDASNVVEPQIRWGIALRSKQVAKGYEVAIKFQAPLQILKHS